MAFRTAAERIRSHPQPQVTFNDFVVFQAKLALDGVKDLLLINLSVVAIVIDMIAGGGRRPRRFYAVVRLGQRFDRWLRLHSAKGFGNVGDRRTSCDGRASPATRPIPSIALAAAGISPGRRGYEPSAAISGARLRIGSVSQEESDSPQEIAP